VSFFDNAETDDLSTISYVSYVILWEFPAAAQRDGSVCESHRGVMPTKALVGPEGFEKKQQFGIGAHRPNVSKERSVGAVDLRRFIAEEGCGNMRRSSSLPEGRGHASTEVASEPILYSRAVVVAAVAAPNPDQFID
jgi:hypothetical protein